MNIIIRCSTVLHIDATPNTAFNFSTTQEVQIILKGGIVLLAL